MIKDRMSDKQTAFEMSSKHSAYFVSLVITLLSAFIKLSLGNEASARSLDLSWRPLSHSPYQQQFYPNGHPAALISYTHFDTAHKDEIVEAAKHNAQLLKKFKEIAHQPITSYSDPYAYSHTPGPSTNLITTSAFLNPNLVRNHQQHAAAPSNLVLQRLPYPGKSAPLYQTKLNFLGKHDANAHHQNSIHQTPGTTPKLAGFTKEHGRVNFHYHHPSFVGNQISPTTKRIPILVSSVTPHPASKLHPVMNKYQAHMALAAASQNHHHHKIKQNSGFSPPSQIMSNYANFGPATSNPYWHHNVRNNPFHFIHNNPDYHHHFHKLPESQQQIMPTVHPSVLTPFLEQVHLKQKEAAATADQKNSQKQSHELSSNENSGSYEVINDVFSKHLVPPPPSQQSPINYKPKPEKQEKMKTFNLSMPSPLQDASRFNYNNVISTATPTNDNLWFKPSASDNNYFTTERPNVFVHLNNRTKENVYKQHKLLHPSYTGGLKKKPFLPTPYRPDKEEEPLRIDYEPQHSFFTIEDAVTPNIPAYQVIKSHIPVEEEPELITYEPIRQYDLHRKPDYDYSATIAPTLKPSTTTASPVESTQKPRQKLRRRKPRPQQKQQQQQQQEQQKQEQQQQQFIETTASDERVKFTVKPNRVRGSIKNVDTQTEQNELKTRNRLNHPNRVRNRLNFSSPAATLSTADYDSTVRTSTEEEKKNDVPTTQQASTESVVLKLEESSERPENVKRRVKLRLKNKLRLNPNINSLESTETRQKLNDNQILDTENVVVKNDETTELSFGTESGLNELRTSLKLPNLKLRNEALTTLPTTADTVSTSMQPSSTTTAEHEENSVLNKINNRPRFSIKEYKRKPLSTTSTATTLLSSATAATTVKPDGQRFNRLRVNLRRRNETSDSGEEEFPRKRYSTTRTTTTTTEAPTQTSSLPRRAPLPKRTFPARNFTKPTINLNEVESTTTNLKPSIKNTTSFVSNRPSSPNLRSRIQYKKKEPTNEVADSSNNFIKTINFSSEAAVTHESTPSSTTSTESPYRETSIMKIAKTPPSVNLEKSTTDDFTDFSVTSDNISRNDFDLTGASSEHSQRVADLTIGTHGGSDSYSFKSANLGPLTRRIPNYFTISTDDPILPIQAFFPQIKTNENN